MNNASRLLKRIALVAALALVAAIGADLAYAGVVKVWAITTTAASPITGTAPSAAVCDLGEAWSINTPAVTGLPLATCKAYYVCATIAGGNFSGAGQFDAYFWDPWETTTNGWGLSKGSAEVISASDSGKAHICFPQRKVEPGSVGCGYWVPNAVTNTGTAVRVYARCVQ